MKLRNLRTCFSKLLQIVFQNDYWSWDDRNLANEATKHNIPHISVGGEHGEHLYMDRAKIINQLVARDNALRTKQIAILSITALLISFGSLILILLRK